MTLYKSEQTYFATHLLHGCFDAKLLNRCFVSPYKYYTKGLHAAVAKPTYAPGSSSPIEDRYIVEVLKIPAIGHLQTPTGYVRGRG